MPKDWLSEKTVILEQVPFLTTDLKLYHSYNEPCKTSC